MIQKIDKGNTLLIKGPARITLLEGKLDILGKIILPEKEVSNQDDLNVESQNVLIIPSAQSYPLYAQEESKLEIYTNVKENLEIIKENSIYPTWIKIKNEIIEDLKKKKEGPLKIMVLGISSGKTTLIKYLANNFLKEGLKGGYIDSDLGQQYVLQPA